MWRYVDGSNYWYARCVTDGKLLMGKMAGSGTQWTSTATGCVAGATVRVSFDGAVHTAFINGTQVLTVTDAAHQTSKKVGFAAGSSAGVYDDWQYTESTAGVFVEPSEGVPGSDEPVDEGSSTWNPIAWLYDKVKGLLIPGEEDWVAISAQWDLLTDYEPIGTLKDLAGFMAGVKTQLTAPDTSAAAFVIPGGSVGGVRGLFDDLGPDDLILGAADMADMAADGMDGFTMGGLSGLTFVKSISDVMVGLALYRYVRGRLTVTV
jgi:hypothetical protein